MSRMSVNWSSFGEGFNHGLQDMHGYHWQELFGIRAHPVIRGLNNSGDKGVVWRSVSRVESSICYEEAARNTCPGIIGYWIAHCGFWPDKQHADVGYRESKLLASLLWICR